MKQLLRNRFIALLLVGVLIISMTACSKSDGGSQPVNEEAQAVESNDDTADEFERPFDKYIQGEEVVDLGGYNFKVVDFHSHRWEPEEITSPMDELVVAIKEDVEKTFNCTITYENVAPDVIFETAQPEIMAGGKYADLIGTTMWAFGKLLGSNLLADLNDVESLNLENSYWNQGVIDTATFGNSTYAFGAPFGSHFGNYWVVYYNARIWNELGLPDPYEMVEAGTWTWDKFVSYAKKATLDMDGDGLVGSENDRWGLTAPSGDLIQSIFFGLGGKYYKEVEPGKVRVACTDAESAEKMNAMYKFYQTDNVLYQNENLGYKEMFAAGKSLFCAYGNGAHTEFKDMEDDFGVLPMPKWNEAQEAYIGAPDHNAPIFAMTSTNKNTYEAGIIIEALGRRYQAYDDLAIEDYENTFWRFDKDREIVEKYVDNHGAYDISNIIKNANSNFDLPAKSLFEGCFLNLYTDIVSTIKSFEDAISVLLDEFFINLSK